MSGLSHVVAPEAHHLPLAALFPGGGNESVAAESDVHHCASIFERRARRGRRCTAHRRSSVGWGGRRGGPSIESALDELVFDGY